MKNAGLKGERRRNIDRAVAKRRAPITRREAKKGWENAQSKIPCGPESSSWIRVGKGESMGRGRRTWEVQKKNNERDKKGKRTNMPDKRWLLFEV